MFLNTTPAKGSSFLEKLFFKCVNTYQRQPIGLEMMSCCAVVIRFLRYALQLWGVINIHRVKAPGKAIWLPQR